MNNLFDKLKKAFGGKEKAEPSVKDMFAKMDSVLQEAEDAVGGAFFPKEEEMPIEEVHYRELGLPVGADFDAIKASYENLKRENNPEKYILDNEKYNITLEKMTKVELAYNYFKKKFNVNE